MVLGIRAVHHQHRHWEISRQVESLTLSGNSTPSNNWPFIQELHSMYQSHSSKSKLLMKLLQPSNFHLPTPMTVTMSLLFTPLHSLSVPAGLKGSKSPTKPCSCLTQAFAHAISLSRISSMSLLCLALPIHP